MSGVANKIKSLIAELIKDKKALVKILSIAVILLMALIFRVHNSNHSDINVEAATEKPETETEELYIDISGAVHRPGVYKVDKGTRLFELIELAGGLRSDADIDSVNQASFVEDGAKIIIPIYSEDNEAESSPVDSSASPAGTESSGLVNINSADKDSLKTLPGVGDVIAERIMEYRSTNRFRSKEDIMLVKGIGNSIYEKIKDEITV